MARADRAHRGGRMSYDPAWGPAPTWAWSTRPDRRRALASTRARAAARPTPPRRPTTFPRTTRAQAPQAWPWPPRPHQLEAVASPAAQRPTAASPGRARPPPQPSPRSLFRCPLALVLRLAIVSRLVASSLLSAARGASCSWPLVAARPPVGSVCDRRPLGALARRPRDCVYHLFCLWALMRFSTAARAPREGA